MTSGWSEPAQAPRMELTADEQIRIAAVQVAAQIGESYRVRTSSSQQMTPGRTYTTAGGVIQAATEIEAWIKGDETAPEPGRRRYPYSPPFLHG